MRTGLHQQTSMRQELRVNPRLYQAMDMLYMPMMDLQQHLKQELLANPFLELLEPEEDESTEEKGNEQEKEQAQKDDEVDWEEILLNGFEVGGQREQFEATEYVEPVTVETTDLDDHLRVESVATDPEPAPRYSHRNGAIRIDFEEKLPAGMQLAVVIDYAGKPREAPRPPRPAGEHRSG